MQYPITNQKAERQTNDWLTANGISPKLFATADINLLKAQKIATDLLKHHREQLTDDQAYTLASYLLATNSKKLMKQISPRRIYAVMNIGKKINRKLFRLNKENIKALNRR